MPAVLTSPALLLVYPNLLISPLSHGFPPRIHHSAEQAWLLRLSAERVVPCSRGHFVPVGCCPLKRRRMVRRARPTGSSERAKAGRLSGRLSPECCRVSVPSPLRVGSDGSAGSGAGLPKLQVEPGREVPLIFGFLRHRFVCRRKGGHLRERPAACSTDGRSGRQRCDASTARSRGCTGGTDAGGGRWYGARW